MTHEQKEANYTQFSINPARIDGAIHNTVAARMGVGFDNNLGDSVDAVEIAFANEPYGNMRSILVADLNAARALRDQLNEIIKEHDLTPPIQTDNFGPAPGMPTSHSDRFDA